MIGSIREMQVASRIADQGGTLIDVNRKVDVPGVGDREFDVLFEQAGERIVGEVKTGREVRFRAGAEGFQDTVSKFVDARDLAADQLGVDRYRVYADDMSADMAAALRERGIEVVANGDFLR